MAQKAEVSSGSLRIAKALAAIRMGLSQADYRRNYGLSQTRTYVLFTSMESMGLIKVIAKGRPVIYALTKRGEEMLELFKTPLKSGSFNPVFRYEHLFFKSEIRTAPQRWEARLKEGGYVVSARRNYKGWQLKGEDATIFVNNRSVWWLVKPIYAKDVSDGLNLALGVVLRLKIEFEERYGFRLGYPEKVVELKRQEVAMLGGMDRFFSKFYKANDRLKFDASSGEPEIETVHKVFALEDMERIYKWTDAIARGQLDTDALKALVDFYPSLAQAIPAMALLAEALKLPKNPRDPREVR